MLTVLECGKPDRVPATIHCWMPYFLDKYLSGRDQLEAFEYFDLDASIYVNPIRVQKTREWKEIRRLVKDDGYVKRYDLTYETPKGSLYAVEEQDPFTPWCVEYPIKKEEDIELLKFMPPLKQNKNAIDYWFNRTEDKGIIRCYVGGVWQLATQLRGQEQIIYDTYDRPDWLHEFLKILLENRLKTIESMKGLKIDLVETGGGEASSTVISPNIFEEFVLPYDIAPHNALKSIGFKTTYHICGGMMKIIELLIKTGADAVETLTPNTIGGDIDLKKAKHKIGNKVSLIGGLDQITFLQKGSPKQVKEEVRRLISEASDNGGYMISTCDHFFDAQEENIKAYSDAAKESGNY